MSKQKSVFVISLLALALVSSALFSLAAAQDLTAEPTAPADRSPVTSDSSNSDEPVLTQDNNATLYSIQDNSTEREPIPEDASKAAEGNLIATQTGTDYTLPVVAIAIVLAIVAGAMGVIFHRKKTVKA